VREGGGKPLACERRNMRSLKTFAISVLIADPGKTQSLSGKKKVPRGRRKKKRHLAGGGEKSKIIPKRGGIVPLRTLPEIPERRKKARWEREGTPARKRPRAAQNRQYRFEGAAPRKEGCILQVVHIPFTIRKGRRKQNFIQQKGGRKRTFFPLLKKVGKKEVRMVHNNYEHTLKKKFLRPRKRATIRRSIYSKREKKRNN